MANKKTGEPKGRGAQHDPTTDAMILMEYARNPRPREIARQFGLKHHSYVTRLWEKLPEERKQEYLSQAQDIHEQVAERISIKEFEFVDTTAKRLADLMNRTLDEYEARINDEARRKEIPTKELTNFVRMAQNFVVNNAEKENADDDKSPATSLFNILDQSISDTLINDKNE